MATLMLPVRSLQARILAPFILVVVLVQVGGYLLINTIGVTAARKSVSAEVVRARESSTGSSSRMRSGWSRERGS